MKSSHLLATIFLAAIMAAGCSKVENKLPVQANDDNLTLKSTMVNNNKYIVVLKDDSMISKSDFQTRKLKVNEKAVGLLKKYDITGEIEEVYETALQGFSIKMSPGQAKKLVSDLNVKLVEADKIIALAPPKTERGPSSKQPSTPPDQIVPPGITRVGGGTTSSNKTAWIIDTGIDYNHPDLPTVAADDPNGGSVTFVSRTYSGNDDNGHGTHVAGIIAAADNSEGVVGVAPGSNLVSVKVLDKRGSGWTSGVIAGVDYVANYASDGDVANMSLGGGVSTSLDAAVIGASYNASTNKNIYFALAAGNESDDANRHSPARANGKNIYTVSAMDSNDNWAYFSNYGSAVDFCAPGYRIYSTYKGGGYTTLSGTSMAAPHVAGLLLIGPIKSDGIVKNDPDGSDDPIAHH